MDQERNQMQSAPQLCGNHCGFYGSPSFDGLCSKCHKDMAKSQPDKPQTDQPASPGAPLSLHETSALLSTSTAQPTVSVLPASSSTPAVSTSSSSPATAGSPPASPAAVSASAAPKPEPQVPAEPSPARTSTGLEADSAADSPAEPAAKKKKSRCGVCRKKVGLTGFTCRCDGLFCSLHRYSDKHDCSFDYRVHGQQEIRKNNPVIVGEKVNKI